MDIHLLKEFLERHRDKTTIIEHEVKAFLRGSGLSVPRGLYVSRIDGIPLEIPLTYPLVAKVSSSRITSKTEVKGVRLGIMDENGLREAIKELFEIRDAEGVLIEEMAPQGVEVIIGGVIDKEFGPIVMFGLGGILVELYKDVAFALAPLKRKDALWLINQVKGYKILSGYRGMPPVDIDPLVDLVITTSEIIATGMVKEIDLNPVALYPDHYMILDAKMKIDVQ
ncbi:MAG: acetate--CoA ligase family protein [Thermodesulfovibrionia bacterium]